MYAIRSYYGGLPAGDRGDDTLLSEVGQYIQNKKSTGGSITTYILPPMDPVLLP